MMTSKFQNKRKQHIILKLEVDGAGDLIVDRKGMIDLGEKTYLAANKVSDWVILRDFKRVTDKEGM